MKIEFESLGYKVYGISKDNVKSQTKFINNFNLTVELLCDTDLEVAKHLSVLEKKKMFGKEYMGVNRDTFVFDTNFKVIKEFRKNKVLGHANTVLEYIKQL